MEFENTRSSKRIPVLMDVRVRSGNRSYDGYVTNVSAHGIGCLITALNLTDDTLALKRTYEAEHLMQLLSLVSEDFAPDKIIEVNFNISSGGQVDISCRPAWFSCNPSKSEAAVGMRITNDCPAYWQFIKDMEKDPEGPSDAG